MSLMHDWQVIGTAKMVSNDGTVILNVVKSGVMLPRLCEVKL